MSVDHYENFPVASLLLPPQLRRPVEIIYRFARSADDIADEGQISDRQRLEGLAAYGAELDRIEAGITPETPLFQDLGPLMVAHALPIGLFRDLLSAFAQDVTVKSYPDYPTLLDYCRRSANPVGRIMLHLFQAATPDNLERSDAICTALQLINFWQDVAIDREKGRTYLPREDLERFGIAPQAVAAAAPAWADLMAFQVERARQLMLAGASLAYDLPGRFGWEIRLTVEGGLRILEKIDRVQGDVFSRRPTLQGTDWALMLLRAALFRR